MSKRAILYARVSTDEQAEKGYSLPTQIEALKAYAEKQGFNIPSDDYIIREDYSGAELEKRPGLTKARGMLKAGRAEALIVFAIDRLTRLPLHWHILAAEFSELGVVLHVVNRGQMGASPESMIAEGMEALFAQYWRYKILEGSMRGRIAKAKAGGWAQFGKPSYGYRLEGQNESAHLVIVPEEAEVIRRVYRDYLDGISMRQIGLALEAEGVPLPVMVEKRNGKPEAIQARGWWRTAIQRILTKPIYKGEATVSVRESKSGSRRSLRAIETHIIPHPELAIVDADTWDRVQAQRARGGAWNPRNVKHEYLLAGRIKCICDSARHGRMLRFKSKQGVVREYHYYRCNHSLSDYQVTSDICREPTMRVDLADPIVWEWLISLFRDPHRLHEGLTKLAQTRASALEGKHKKQNSLKALIDKANREIARLTKFAGEEEDDELAEDYRQQAKAKAAQRTSWQKDLTPLTAELDLVDLTAERIAQIEEWAAMIHEAGGLEQDVSFETKRHIMHWLDVRAKVEYREGVRGLALSCALPYGETWEAAPSGKRPYTKKSTTPQLRRPRGLHKTASGL